MPLESFVQGESDKAEYRKGVSGQVSAQDFRQLFCNHLSAGYSDKSGDMVILTTGKGLSLIGFVLK